MAKKSKPAPAPIEEDHDRRIQEALAAGVPQYYINGFVTRLTHSDLVVITELNGKPTLVLNMSFTVAKTVATSIGGLIAQLEEITGRNMLTTKDIDEEMQKRAVKEQEVTKR